MAYTFIILIVSTTIITILNYFSILSGNTLKLILNIVIILSLFIGGYLTGTKASKKGYLEGIKFGIVIITLILLLNLLIFKNKFSLINFLYYPSLLITSTLGSMLGIQRRKI